MKFDFEKLAMHGEPLPKGLDIADSCLYIGLKNLYAMYYGKLISKKDATEEKKSLVYNWTKQKSEIEFLSRETMSLNERILTSSKEYKNNPCIDNAEKLYAAFYNLPEDWRKKDESKSPD